MIVIYTPEVTNRIKYTLDFVFSRHLGVEYALITNLDAEISPEQFYISYDTKKHNSFFSIYQTSLLLEDRVVPQKLFVSRESDLPVFYQTTDDFDISFDIFSCIFYLLTRYEEYLPHEQDIHGRYMSSNSILSNPVFDFTPIVDMWLEHLKQQLLQHNSALNFRNHSFEYLPTFDIDNAYKYRGRSWLKNPPNIFKQECRNVIFKREPDPYDTYDFILSELKINNVDAHFFFLMNDDNHHNSNVDPATKILHDLILKIKNESFKIGIHPSYYSLHHNSINEEKELLDKVTNENILFARQHFLRIGFPHYFNAIIEAGIQHDYSLFYPDIVGFRAGYSRSFYFFDLLKNQQTSLLLHPTCWMDATFEYYENYNIEEIQQKILQLLEQLIKINAKLVTLFHNDLLSMEKYRGIFSFFNRHTNLRG